MHRHLLSTGAAGLLLALAAQAQAAPELSSNLRTDMNVPVISQSATPLDGAGSDIVPYAQATETRAERRARLRAERRARRRAQQEEARRRAQEEEEARRRAAQLPTTIRSAEQAADFLDSAGFGGNPAELSALLDRDAADILRQQFDLPFRSYLPRTRALSETASVNRARTRAEVYVWLNDAIAADDALRQRAVFALSQIVVASHEGGMITPEGMAFYLDALGRNAFGNYRDLLEDVTYTPAMGRFLTYSGNRRANPRRGTEPDENYARELMQLFTIGLVELNPDGTPRLDASGNTIPTFGGDDVGGLARVFTGLRIDNNGRDDRGRRIRIEDRRMSVNARQHELGVKRFLGGTVPAGTGAEASIDQALDIIFANPNVGPFVSRQLIQRMTASSPEPAYVARVSRAFDTGRFQAPNGERFGTGRRGDLQATFAAILLDESQFRDDQPGNATDIGKVRDPVLNLVHWARAFDVSPVTTQEERELIREALSPATGFGMMPFQSPSVFNFYRPGFVAAGTESAAAGLTVPEFQILLSGNRAGYADMMSNFVFDATNARQQASLVPDYSEEIALSDDPDALAEHLDTLLMNGRMTDATRATVVEIVNALPVNTATPTAARNSRLRRVQAAVTVAVTAPEYMIR